MSVAASLERPALLPSGRPSSLPPVATRQPHDPRTLVAIDAAVAEPQLLLNGLRAGVDALLLDRRREGIAQISEALAATGATCLHIVCHGGAGELRMGSSAIRADDLERQKERLRNWGVDEICLHACHVAADPDFLDQLQECTGASLAASAEAVGQPALGGSWDLEARRGAPAALSPFTQKTRWLYPATFALSNPSPLAFASSIPLFVDANPLDVLMGDFNGDGFLDIVTANYGSNSVSLLLGTGTGSFAPAKSISTVGKPAAVVVGDFNGDGKLDLATANYNNYGGGSRSISILFGTGTGTFLPAVQVPAIGRPRDLVVADINGDGKQDLVTADRNNNSMTVYLGDGKGAFTPLPPQGAPTGDSPSGMVLFDCNGDGRLDVITANYNSNNLAILLGSPNGGFAPAQFLGAGPGAAGLAVGDVDNDGINDLIVTNLTGNSFNVLLGNGAGGFTNTGTFAVNGSRPFGVVVGDFNGDGNLDVVTGNSGSSNLSMLLGNGSGSFAAPLLIPNGVSPSNPYWIQKADLNGDGNLDLVVATYAANELRVFLGDGNGGFGPATGLATIASPRAVAIGDINKDGKLDLVSANFSTGNISRRLGDGAGNFSPSVSFSVGGNPDYVVLADVNGDGNLDAIAANQNTNTVSVLLGDGTGSFGAATNFGVGARPRVLNVGDVNGDGKVDIVSSNDTSDSVSLLLGDGTGNFLLANGTQNNPSAIASGDFNGDGRIDMVTANRYSNSISVLLANPNGGFLPANNIILGSQPLSVTTADVNGDGKLDIVAGNYNSNNVSVLLGTGTGGFGGAANFTVGGRPRAIVTGDFNKDGKLDIATANGNFNSVSVLLGLGGGVFGPNQDVGVGNLASSLALGDVNGDGNLDLSVSNQNGASVSLLLGTGTGAFRPAGGTDNKPVELVVADFNGDGRPDLINSNRLGNSITLQLGLGKGGFGPARSFSVTSTPEGIAVGDFNKDGKLDVAVANASNVVKSITVLFGTGTGSFTNAGDVPTGSATPFQVATGDFNGDGNLDLVTANRGYNSISLLLGTGTIALFGAPTAFSLAPGSNVWDLAVGDLNGDGKLDVVTANANTANIGVLLGNGAGSFGAPTFFTAGSTPRDVVLSDVNGDGKLDAITANYSSNNISVLLGNGDGTFAAATNFSTGGSNPVKLAITDYNNDGKKDVVVSNQNSANVAVMLGDGTGSFALVPSLFGVGSTPLAVVAGDFNGDGLPDIATANYNANSTSVLLNRTNRVLLNDAAPKTIDGSLETNSSLTADLATGKLFINSLPLVGPVSVTGYVNVKGTQKNDRITGSAAANALEGLGGNDTINGGLGNDSYLFNANTPLGSDVLSDTGGIDTLNFISTTTKAVSVNLGITTAQVVTAGNLTLTLTSATAFDNVNGGSLNDTLIGNGLNNNLSGGGGNDTMEGLGGNDTLNGGAANDTYNFDADNVLGSDTLADPSGIDTLNFASTTTKAVAVNLGITTAQVVTAGNLTLTLTSATAFENATGGSLADTLTGNGLANNLVGGAGNDSINGAAGADLITGSAGKDTLTGGGGAGISDRFLYPALTDSLLAGFDVITDYIGSGATPDQIDAPASIAPVTLTASLGTAASLSEAAIQAVLTNVAFGANAAAAFTVTGQSGTFVALNNGVAGFQAASDAVLQLNAYNIGAATPIVIV